MCALAYIQSIWWDTSILEKYNVGHPRFMTSRDLERPVHEFKQWIDEEERKWLDRSPESLRVLRIEPMVPRVHDHLDQVMSMLRPKR